MKERPGWAAAWDPGSGSWPQNMKLIRNHMKDIRKECVVTLSHDAQFYFL